LPDSQRGQHREEELRRHGRVRLALEADRGEELRRHGRVRVDRGEKGCARWDFREILPHTLMPDLSSFYGEAAGLTIYCWWRVVMRTGDRLMKTRRSCDVPD
jgi:hypothetical protein